MKNATTERDPGLTAAYTTVFVAGCVVLLGAGISFGVRAMLATGLGTLLALANLWVLEKLVSAYLKAGGGRWAAIATVKAGLLLALVTLLIRSGVVGLLPIIAGFAALPIGILVAGLVPRPSPREES